VLLLPLHGLENRDLFLYLLKVREKREKKETMSQSVSALPPSLPPLPFSSFTYLWQSEKGTCKRQRVSSDSWLHAMVLHVEKPNVDGRLGKGGREGARERGKGGSACMSRRSEELNPPRSISPFLLSMALSFWYVMRPFCF